MSAIINTYTKTIKLKQSTILITQTIKLKSIKSIFKQQYLNIYYIIPNDYLFKFDPLNPKNIECRFIPISLSKPTLDQLNDNFDLCCDPNYEKIIPTLNKYSIYKHNSHRTSTKARIFTECITKYTKDLLNTIINQNLVGLTKLTNNQWKAELIDLKK